MENKNKEENYNLQSLQTCSSQSATSSQVSQAITKAQAKDKAAQAKAVYPQQEKELKVEQACLQANL